MEELNTKHIDSPESSVSTRDSTSKTVDLQDLFPNSETSANESQIPRKESIQMLRKRSSKMRSPLSLLSFDFLNVLGEGRYGTVFLVRKKEGGKLFALKAVKKSLIKKKKFCHRIVQEREVLGRCNSEFITQFYGSFHNEKNLFFLLDYCPGGDFFTLISRKTTFQEKDAKFYAAQLVLTIEYLHSMDILYRDLKPENIFIDKKGYLKLGDFGYATQHVDELEAKAICGTPHYCSPEIITREGHGKGVDWWSLGCIIFEMISGIAPFHDQNQKLLFERIKSYPVNFELSNKKFSNQAKDLILKLLQKDQKLRLGSLGAEEVKTHPWFGKMDWEGIANQTIVAPFIPVLKKSTDISNFDQTITSKQIGDLSGESTDSSDEEGEEAYKNFYYDGTIIK